MTGSKNSPASKSHLAPSPPRSQQTVSSAACASQPAAETALAAEPPQSGEESPTGSAWSCRAQQPSWLAAHLRYSHGGEHRPPCLFFSADLEASCVSQKHFLTISVSNKLSVDIENVFLFLFPRLQGVRSVGITVVAQDLVCLFLAWETK